MNARARTGTLLDHEKLRELLEKSDKEIAEKVREEGCRHCEPGVLHRADYARKPRGLPDTNWDKRASFCCDEEGCRKRHTPPSMRFMGPKVYLAVVIVLLSAMMHGCKPARVASLREMLGVDKRTLERWRKWWLEQFRGSGFWKAWRGRFTPRLDEMRLAYALLKAFGGFTLMAMLRLLRWLSPITERGGMARA